MTTRRARKGKAQYSNRTVIPGAELATPPASTITPYNNQQQSSPPTLSSARTASNTPTIESPDGPSRGRQGPARPVTPPSPGASDRSNSSPGCMWSAGSSPGRRNREARPLTPPATPPRLARPTGSTENPWELPGFEYPPPKRQNGLLSFQWPKVWLSFEGKKANEELRKELIAHRQFTLPLPLPSTDVAPHLMKELEAENNKIRNIYYKHGQSQLFDIRMKHKNFPYDASLIFSSRLPALNGRDPSTWSDRNLPKPRNHSGYVAKPNFFNIVQTGDLWAMILNNLKPSVRDLSAVAMTCKSVARATKFQFEVWRFEDGEFDVDDFATKREDGRLLQRHGVRSDILLLTGGRPYETASPYADDLECMLKFCQAVRYTPFSFRDVVLHRIPFLDPKILSILAKGMPNLETLAISSCLLLDATKLPFILKIILNNPRTTKSGGKSYIKADFAPYRFFGPQTLDKFGTYIITHHKPNFDIPKAATALLYRCLPDAKKVGMDLLSDSSSFWHFFRQLPGPCPLWAVKVREAIVTQERHKPQSDDYLRALDNLCAAVSGDNRSPEYLPPRRYDRNFGQFRKRRMPYNYWRTEKDCPACKTTLSHCLFVNSAPNNPNGRAPNCWGCHLGIFVKNYEHSHFRERQLTILKHLLARPVPPPPPKPQENTTDANSSTGADTSSGADPAAATNDSNAGTGTGTDTDPGANPGAATDEDGPTAAAEADNDGGDAAGGHDHGGDAADEDDHGDAKDDPKDDAKDNKGVVESAKDTGATDDGVVRDYYDDDGIFDTALFSVKSLSDPLLDKHDFDTVFTYKTINFMAQNIGCARRLAQLTDDHWNYYRGLEHSTWGQIVDWNTVGKHTNSEPLKHAPELDVGEFETLSGTVSRWMRYYNPPTGPSDYLQGGPQYRSPFIEQARPPLEKATPGKLNFDEFCQDWVPCHTFFSSKLRQEHLEYLTRMNGKGKEFFFWAQEHPSVMKRSMKHMNMHWRKQHEKDWLHHVFEHPWSEDAIYSLCAPGKVVYNHDERRMQSERDNAQWELRPYCSGIHRQ